MSVTKKITIAILFWVCFCKPADAFFPFPVPLIGTDIANNGADLSENMTTVANKLEQQLATLRKMTEELKSGSFGYDAISKYYDELKAIDLPRDIPAINAPKQVGENINDPDETAKNVANIYINSYSEKGGHTDEAKRNRQKRLELLQANVSSMYAHALATRFHLAEERKMPDSTLQTENTREIIQSIRAMRQKTTKRWNEILFMEAQITEYNASKLATIITLSSEEAKEQNVAFPEGENK